MTRGARVHARRLVQLFPADGGQVAALQGVDLDIAAGERVAVVGPSGSGKSTLLGLLAGAIRPSAGRLEVDGVELSTVTPQQLHQLRAGPVATLLQGGSRNLLGWSSAVNNIGFARRAVPRRAARDLPPAEDLLTAVALPPRTWTTPVARLSGGEQQRVALAVALANSPTLVLADEPTSDLDADNRDQVLELLAATAEEHGHTAVIVTHDPVVAAAQPRVVTLRDGRIADDTAPRAGASAGSVVIDADGRFAIPAHLRDRFPPGAAVTVHLDRDGLRLTTEPT